MLQNPSPWNHDLFHVSKNSFGNFGVVKMLMSTMSISQVESVHLLPIAMVNAFGQTSPALTTAAEIYQVCFSRQRAARNGKGKLLLLLMGQILTTTWDY